MRFPPASWAACVACLLPFFPTPSEAAAPDVVPEVTTDGYVEVYRIDIPVDASWGGSTPVPYTLDQTAGAPEFDRAGYFLELGKADGSVQWVWASFAESGTAAASVGLPHSTSLPAIRQRTVDSLNVASNVAGVATGTAIAGGRVEMWTQASSMLNTASVVASDQYTQRFDWGDSPDTTKPAAGSFQIHNPVAGQVVMAWNGWAASGTADDVGIGTNATPINAPDWTDSANTAAYATRRLSIWVRPARFSVTLSKQPQYSQITPRQLTTNTATVPVTGAETRGGWEQAVLRVKRNGISSGADLVQPLVYSAGSAPFDFQPVIPAERASYDLELWLRKAGSPDRLARKWTDLCAGDVFLVYGQSNAVAAHHGGGYASLSGYTSPWIRTYGIYTSSVPLLQNSLYWSTAYPDDYNFYFSCIGQWAGVLGWKIQDAYNVPVAIINGARGGTSIDYLQRDHLQPNELSDNGRIRPYNRMRYLADQAGVRENVRAVFFYQGESDPVAASHVSGFTGLRADLLGDFPALEHIYATQLYPGQDGAQYPIALRDAQRRLEDLFPDVSVTTANALTTADGVHLNFNLGYRQLGERFFLLARRDLYGHAANTDADAPNPARAEFVKPLADALLLPWRRPVQGLTIETGALADFKLEGSTARVTGAQNSPGGLLLTLDRAAPEATAVIYTGHASATGWVRNTQGLPLMALREPVSEKFPTIRLDAPTASAGAIADPVTIHATALPNAAPGSSPITSVTIKVDGAILATTTSAASLGTTWFPASEGRHTIEALTLDASGHGAAAQFTYTVSHLAAPPWCRSEGIISWLSAWRPVPTETAATVPQWPDGSGRAHSPSAPDNASRPSLAAGGIGLAPALSFSAASRLTSPDAWPTGDWTAALFFDLGAPAGGSLISTPTAAAGAWSAGLDSTSRLVLRQNNLTVSTGTTPLSATAPHVLVIDCDGSTGTTRLWLDSEPALISTLSLPLPAGPWQLGGGFTGCIAEFALFSRKLDATERDGLRRSTLALAGLASQTYATWAADTLPPGTASGPTDDPDGDSIPNLIEYTFGTPPLLVTTHRNGWTAGVEGAYFVLRFTRPLTRPDATITPQYSPSLSGWNPLPSTLEAQSAASSTWTARQPVNADRTFFRLLVLPSAP